MRMVSWIVVAGSLAWLLYGQLRTHFTDQELAGVMPNAVRGTMKSERPGADRPDAGPHVIAYADLYPMLVAAASSESEMIAVTTHVRSTLHGVKPPEIRLTLDDGEQTHRFPIDRRGHVRVPLRADWRDENRQIVSNQPQGTLALEVVGVERFGGEADPARTPLPLWAAHPEP